MHRLAGLETEYGCLTDDPAGPAGIVARVRNWIFAGHRFGLLDQHQRDWDEPAGNGGFLFNGGRAYVDMGHLEICTPECMSLRDLVAHDRANDLIITAALQALGVSGHAGFVRNNVDHFTGATFGCHENYLVRRTAPLHEANVLSLLAFLSLRTLYTGAGKVGALPGVELRGGGEPPMRAPDFQISQRADYIQNDLFEWVQFNRALINTRDEPLADSRRFRRLHLLHGDTSVLPETLALKIGSTALVLDLLEIDHLPKVVLNDAVAALRQVSRQPDGPWLVSMSGGGVMPAVAVLRLFQKAAESEFRGRDEETDQVLNSWSDALDALEGDRERLIGRVDWITKRWLFEQFVAAQGIAWDDIWLKSQDIEFHQVEPSRNLGLSLCSPDSLWTPDPARVEGAMTAPPSDTRAALRAMALRELVSRGVPGFVDWEVVDAEGVNPLVLPDPFATDPVVVKDWLLGLDERRKASQVPIIPKTNAPDTAT